MKKGKGGDRGGRRPLKYGEETLNVTFRLPKSKVQEVKELIKLHLKKYEVK
jgi:hypothetical protein